ncbi:hypothetical protein GYH30_029570 [Glycine max]|nr:hypothetical protein GYH30_029570 [Glycine max]
MMSPSFLILFLALIVEDAARKRNGSWSLGVASTVTAVAASMLVTTATEMRLDGGLPWS